MSKAVRRRLVWGWMRLPLGIAQMTLSAAGLGALVTIGLHRLTWALFIAATAAMVVSRLL